MTTASLICLAVTGLSIYPSSDTICKYAEVVVEESEKNNIDPPLLVGLIGVESNWKPHVKSWAGACGLTQVLPRYTKKYGNKGRNLTCDELKDPVTSIQVGSRVLSYWIDTYANGRYKTGLCGYNAGFRCKGDSPNGTGMRYAKKVLKYKRKLDRAIKRVKNEDNKYAKSCNRLFFRVGAFCF